MKTLLAVSALLALGLSSAGACEFMRSVQTEKVDDTKVASIAVPQSTPSTDAAATTDTTMTLPPADSQTVQN